MPKSVYGIITNFFQPTGLFKPYCFLTSDSATWGRTSFFDLPQQVAHNIFYETQDSQETLVIQIELPGFRYSNIKTFVSDSVLLVEASSHTFNPDNQLEQKTKSKRKYSKQCLNYDDVIISFDLDFLETDLDVKNISKLFSNGVLEIRVPKNETKSKLREF